MPTSGGMAYLPAMSHLIGEVEQPTSQQAYQQPFSGNPQQLQQMLMSPGIQQQLQQAGIHFDPSMIQQSPFFHNNFLGGHPQMQHMLSGAMANMAMTPDAPMVSGAGNGISRAMQGMAGGQQMQRQFQNQQLMAPMQGMGMTIPYQEFQRKNRLMDLLEQMEGDRSNLAHGAQDFQHGQPIKTPYGLMYPGQQVPQEMQGQQQHLGSQPPFQLFNNQGQQQFGQQGPPHFEPYDPSMIQAQTDAKRSTTQKGTDTATAGLTTARAGEVGAKTDELKQETAKGKPGAVVDNLKAGANQKNAGANLSRSRAKDIDQYGGPGKRAASKTAGSINLQYDKEWQKVGRDIMLINQDPKKSPEEKKQAEADANQRFARIEQDRQRDLANLQASGVPANTPPPGVSPQAGPMQQPAAPQAKPQAGPNTNQPQQNAVPKGAVVVDPNGNPHTSDGTHPLPTGWKLQKQAAAAPGNPAQ